MGQVVHHTLRTALVSDGFNAPVHAPCKRVGFHRTFESEPIAAAASLPMVEGRRRTTVSKIFSQNTEEHQLKTRHIWLVS